MQRNTWTFRAAVATAFLACLLGAFAKARADSTYSKVVAIQLQGASNTDIVVDQDNNINTVKFDTGLNYFATKDNFKISLKANAVKDKTYDVYLKAFVLKNQGSQADVYYFVYDDDSTSGFPTVELQTDPEAFLKNVDTTITIDVLNFPIDDDNTHSDPILLQAIAIDSDNKTFGMDSKLFYWNWLNTNPRP